MATGFFFPFSAEIKSEFVALWDCDRCLFFRPELLVVCSGAGAGVERGHFWGAGDLSAGVRAELCVLAGLTFGRWAKPGFRQVGSPPSLDKRLFLAGFVLWREETCIVSFSIKAKNIF